MGLGLGLGPNPHLNPNPNPNHGMHLEAVALRRRAAHAPRELGGLEDHLATVGAGRRAQLLDVVGAQRRRLRAERAVAEDLGAAAAQQRRSGVVAGRRPALLVGGGGELDLVRVRVRV